MLVYAIAVNNVNFVVLLCCCDCVLIGWLFANDLLTEFLCGLRLYLVDCLVVCIYVNCWVDTFTGVSVSAVGCVW